MAESKFVNPFTDGVSYEMFLEAKGKKTVAEYCKDKLTDDEIRYIEEEINLIKK